MLFVVTPAGQLFDALHDLDDLDDVYARSAAHGVQFAASR